jgi:hypothetical protein
MGLALKWRKAAIVTIITMDINRAVVVSVLVFNYLLEPEHCIKRVVNAVVSAEETRSIMDVGETV